MQGSPEERTYCAFISYRHVSPDQKIATRLLQLIERYNLPKPLRKKLGIRHPGKVFRDQDELPLSEDLGKDIEAALDHSTWLIALCSPRYLQSRWCMREIDYFLQHHPRDHVLTLLVEGEPEESFPEILRFTLDDDGNRKETEPLAGDVRGKTVRENLKKLNHEKLRLLAPMLGVSYDDLYQREHRRFIRKSLIISGAAVLILGGFLAYALVQNARIDAERRAAARNECDLLVEKSLSKTAAYRRQEARSLALEARNVSEQLDGYGAENVSDALAATCYMGDFSVDAALDLPGTYAELYTFSPDGKKIAAVVSSSAVFCFDADTGEQLWDATPSALQLTSLTWSPDSGLLALTSMTGHHAYVLDAETGNALYDVEVPWACGAAFDGENILIAFGEGILKWNPKAENDSLIYAVKASQPGELFLSRLSQDHRLISWINHLTSEAFAYNTETGYAYGYKPEDQRMLSAFAFSPDGLALFLRQGAKIRTVNLETDEIVWERDVEEPYGGMELTDSAVWTGNRIFDCGHLYDAETGESVAVLEEESAEVSADGLYFLCRNGIYRVTDGSLYAASPGTILAADPTGKYLLIQRDTVSKDTMPGKGSYRRIENYSGKLFDVPDWTQPGESFPLNDPVAWGAVDSNNMYASRLLISPDTRYYVMINAANHIKVFDTTKGNEPVYRFYGYPMNGFPSVGDASFSADGRLLGVVGDMGTVAVYDLETGRVIRFWRDLYRTVSLEGIRFNRDGTLVMVAGYNNRLFAIFSVANGLNLYTVYPEKTVSDWGFDEESGDGIIVYEDGSALAADIFTTAEELYAFAGP